MNRKTLIALTLFALMLAAFPTLAQDNVNPDDGIDQNEAQAIALAQYPDASVVTVDRTTEYGARAWDVMLDNGMAVYVNAQTGAIIELEPWRSDWQRPVDSGFVVPLMDADPVDIGSDGVDVDEARSIALSFYPDAAVVALDLERADGIDAWDVMLDNGMAVYINAGTGAVIEFERWTGVWSDSNWDGDTAPWASFPGGRRAWETQQGMTTDAGTPDNAITREQAIAIALAQFPGTSVVEVKTGTEYGRPVWDIELSNGVYLDISMATGDIVDIYGIGGNWQNPNFVPDAPGAAVPSAEGGINRDDAIAIALALYPGTRVIEVSTGTDSGVRVWDIELSNGVYLDISMVTGEIVDIYGGSSDWDSSSRDWDNDDDWDDYDDWDDDDD
jgi:uncharacterized membrane protein YkoI